MNIKPSNDSYTQGMIAVHGVGTQGPLYEYETLQ